MKKIIFLVTSLFIISFAKADTNISLKNYLDEKSIEDQRAAYDNLMLKSIRPKKKTKKKIKKRNRLFIHVFYKQYN